MSQEELFGQDKIYQALLQSVTEYVVAINRDFQVIVANDLFKKDFGVQADDYCYRLWKGRSERCEACTAAETFRDGMPRTKVETVILADGREACVCVRSMPVMDDQGRVVYVLQTATDLSRRENLEREWNHQGGGLNAALADRLNELQRSEEKYRTIFERSRDAILLTDGEGRILEVNQAGVEIFGYETKDEILALDSPLDLFDDPQAIREIREEILGKGTVKEFEARMVAKGGRRFDAVITSNVIVGASGEVTGYVMILRDITKRKRIQEKMETQNLRLATLNAVSMAVNSSLELQDVLQSTMDKIVELLRADSARIYRLDKHMGVLRLASHRGLSPDFVTKPHVRTRTIGQGFLGQTVQNKTVWVIDNLLDLNHPYGQDLVEEGLRSTVYMPLIAKGEPVGALCVSSHEPFRFSPNYVKFLESIAWQIGVALHHAELYEELRRAYEDLKRAQEQLVQSEKLASLGKLAATMAHEINNPLASVLTYTRLISKMLRKGDIKGARAKDVSRYLGTMESEIKRCGEIVKNLLAFSRHSSLDARPHPVGEIIEKALRIVGHDLEMREIRVVKEIEPTIPPVFCDFRQIQQVLLNLMSNAAESMQEGGVLSIEARTSPKAGFLEVSISDTGCGIADELISSIFEPFFTTKEEGKGVGLGLSVAYGIVERHGGHIEVESRMGEGSRFTVYLPVVPEAPSADGGTPLEVEGVTPGSLWGG